MSTAASRGQHFVFSKAWSAIRNVFCRHQRTEQPVSPSPDGYPSFPPPAPEEIIRNREAYAAIVRARKYAAPRGVYEDTSLFALYRIYELIMLDNRYGYRNLIEWFWRQNQWSICDIPDPQDETPSRYAFLACLTKLIARSFNERISNGLRRGTSSLVTMDELEEQRAQPEELRPYERVPAWAEAVPRLAEALFVPTEDGMYLDAHDDKRADADFMTKNIILWTPHVYFT